MGKMTTKEAYLGINKEIRKLEAKQEKINDSNDTNHILHLLLSLLTAGFWIPVWILMSINSSKTATNKKLEELYELRDEAELKLKLKVI